MATICVENKLPDKQIMLRFNDELECRAHGLNGDQAVRESAARSDEVHSVYVDGELAACWGFASQSLFSYRCSAWLLTTPVCYNHKVLFARSSQRCLGYIFERFEEIEVTVYDKYADAMKWLLWLKFKPIGHYRGFTVMLAKKESARWVS